MQFNELVFLAFFGAVLLLHNLPLAWSVRKFNLLWLSYIFYAAWNPPFVILLWISTVADWFLARWLYNASNPVARRWLLITSLVVNLGMLSYFKYGGFLLENFVALVNLTGFDWHPAAPSIVLPVGISFYTFQTLSYTLDVHARRAVPCSSFLDYALYVTFFPQLVAGPVVRSRQFLPQCEAPRVVSANDFGWGMSLFVLGLFQKIVVADSVLALPVEQVFDSSAPPTALDAWVGSMGFAVQVFCDFSGYSLCAIGVAKCLGFDLPDNFRFPFAATSVSAFWRRWHISVSSWIRDYVYASVRGRSRGRDRRWVFTTVFSSCIVGLWHGAAWHWVLWGLAIGLLILVENAFRATTPALRLWSTKPAQFCFAFLTFAQFSATMVFARSPNNDRLTQVGSAMLLGGSDDADRILKPETLAVISAVGACYFLGHWLMRHSTLERVAGRLSWAARSLVLAALLGVIVLARAPDRAFVYFQF
jgi:alginate O-acetyltransferase complex protein AlgI